MRTIIYCGVACLAGFLSITSTATASTFRVMLESDENRAAGAEIFMASYGTYEDVVSSNAASLGFSQLDVGANFSVGGLAYDGQYRVMLESNDNRGAGAEVFMASFDTFDDLMSANAASLSFSQLNVGTDFSVGGFAYDGQYRVMLESDENRNAGAEIFMASYDTFDDLLAANAASLGFSQLNVGTNFSVGGLAYDGQYRVMLESDENRNAGAEIFMASYDSFDDLMASNAGSLTFSQLNVGANFSVGGFAFEPDPITPVPLPASGLMLVSVLGAGAAARRARSRRHGG